MASAARPRAPQGGRRWNFRAFSALWDRFSLLRTSFSTSFASIHASSNAGSAVLQAPCSKSPRSTSLRCDHASAPNSGKPLASQGTRPLIFERSRCLRHLYGSGPESPSSIFLRCVPGFAGQSSTVRADTYAEDSRLLLLRCVQASAPSIYIYIYIYIHSEVPIRGPGVSGYRRTQHRPTCALLARSCLVRTHLKNSEGLRRCFERS